MKNKTSLVAILIIAMFTIFIGCGEKVEKTDKIDKADKIEYPTKQKDSVVVVTVGVESQNVLQVLNANHEVNEVSSAMGTFVKGIDGVENNMTTFWFFEINGEMASKAADLIPTTPSDTIIWYFRQPGAEPASEPKDTL